MRTILLHLIIGLTAISQQCIAQNNKASREWEGKTEVKDLDKNFPWFHEGYEAYKPDSVSIAQLSDNSKKLTFIVFGGTWCGDTKRELPRFYKVTDQSNIDRKNITLYLLNHDKKSPEKLEKKYKISAVPTFIIFIDGREAGRIIESPEISIEKDLESLFK